MAQKSTVMRQTGKQVQHSRSNEVQVESRCPGELLNFLERFSDGVSMKYTRPKKKLLAFSFAKFEMTRGSRGMPNVSFHLFIVLELGKEAKLC